jgi:hypothetical protein
MAKTVLFSGLQIPTDQSNSTKAKGTGIWKNLRRWSHKEVINSFDQLALLNEVEKISKRQW